MIKLSCTLLLLTLLCGCSLVKRLNKQESRHDINIQHQLQHEENRQQLKTHSLWIRDTLDQQLFVEILPTGPFRYSPGEGFTGSAGSVKISGRKQQRSESLTNSQQILALQKQQRQLSRQSEVEKLREKALEKERVNAAPHLAAYLTILALLAFLWYTYKAQKNDK
ncbi:hypothetical protein D9M68_463400 [compost metagenome]